MTGITKDELMQMARGCDHLWDDSGADDVDNAAWLIAFTNAILERAASECSSYSDRDDIRALKINTGD